MTTVTFTGNSVPLTGQLPEIKENAPSFSLCGNDLTDITLNQFFGKKVILNIFPSIDTPVCANSVIKFNELATEHTDIVILGISADLPFATSRFNEQNNIEHVMMASCFRSNEFAKDYGVCIGEGPLSGLTARAVIVLNEIGQVLYTELVSEITDAPNYDAALSVL
ncbi:thiol peroxidase [Photobacterium indicum]|jgi:thioredoxin-dependent peroxiredoxin|uniref:Thiol peroxidase n=1 Tax=Photobacterium indicum TaxID=81447 RepID=A0A2T3LD21_9GAMM|nr:thiol peroxidase [Photobacterium indicum]PSV49280.1 thiol peroxidase [Photobacterium indicum]